MSVAFSHLFSIDPFAECCACRRSCVRGVEWCSVVVTLSCCDSLPVLPTMAIFFTLPSHFFSSCAQDTGEVTRVW